MAVGDVRYGYCCWCGHQEVSLTHVPFDKPDVRVSLWCPGCVNTLHHIAGPSGMTMMRTAQILLEGRDKCAHGPVEEEPSHGPLTPLGEAEAIVAEIRKLVS